MLGFTAANIFAVAYFDWSFTHSWGGHSVSALMIIDTVVMMAAIYGLYCLIHGVPSEAITELVENPGYSERDFDL